MIVNRVVCCVVLDAVEFHVSTFPSYAPIGAAIGCSSPHILHLIREDELGIELVFL